MPPEKMYPQKRPRSGLTTLEMIVSGSLLSVLISVSASLTFRIQRLQKESAYRVIALQEVANVLEDCIAKRIGTSPPPMPSENILREWPAAFFEIEDAADDLGLRFTVSLRLDEDPKRRPIRLRGWRIEDTATHSQQEPDEPTDNDESEQDASP